MTSSTPAAPTADLGIREFSRQSGYSEAKVRRAMRELQIKGKFQGRGKATLLSPDEQERLALHIDEIELQGNQSMREAAEDLPGDLATPSSPLIEADGPSASGTPAETQAEIDRENEAVLDQLWEAHQAQQLAPQSIQQPAQEQSAPQLAFPQPAQPASNLGAAGQQEADSQHHDFQRYDSHDQLQRQDCQEQERSPVESPTARHLEPPMVSQPRPHPNPQSLAQPVTPPGPLSAPSQPTSAYYDPYFDSHPTVAPPTRIQPGNHRQVLAPPSLPESYDLGQFRSEDNITTLADPGAIAAQAMGAIEALVHGMDADIHQQRIHLEETQRAAHTLRLKAKQLQEKKIEYMIQSSTLGQAQQQSTVELQDALEGIQALGKSPSGEPTSP